MYCDDEEKIADLLHQKCYKIFQISYTRNACDVSFPAHRHYDLSETVWPVIEKYTPAFFEMVQRRYAGKSLYEFALS